jgi:hypothetical protein
MKQCAAWEYIRAWRRLPPQTRWRVLGFVIGALGAAIGWPGGEGGRGSAVALSDGMRGAKAGGMEDDEARRPPDTDGEPVLDEQDPSLGPKPGHFGDGDDDGEL